MGSAEYAESSAEDSSAAISPSDGGLGALTMKNRQVIGTQLEFFPLREAPARFFQSWVQHPRTACQGTKRFPKVVPVGMIFNCTHHNAMAAMASRGNFARSKKGWVEVQRLCWQGGNVFHVFVGLVHNWGQVL